MGGIPSNPSATWDPYDLKGSWVAVFLLFLFWWLAHIPPLFHKSEHAEAAGGKGVDEEASPPTSPLPPVDGEYTNYPQHHSRSKRVAKHFRDGLLFLLTAIAITFAASGPPGATNTLSWIFAALWILLGILMYFFKWRRLLKFLSLLDLVLLIALISNAFAHPATRSQRVG